MKNRMVFIDRLRILATILVVLHHTAITYGASGDWIYKEGSSPLVSIILTLFVAINQSFFMGMFFLFSGYFTLKSLQKKSGLQFIGSRLLRLGIPLVFYYFIFAPLIVLLFQKQTGVYFRSLNIFQYLWDCWKTGTNLEAGPLWFVQAVLLFSFLFLPLHKVASSFFIEKEKAFPKAGVILAFLFGAGILTFIVRIFIPIGIWILNFQLAHFVQYLLLFSVGIMAAQKGWLTNITQKTGRFFLVLAIILIIFLPVFLFISIYITGSDDLAPFNGGFTWQSALNSLWEQLVGGSIIIVLLYLFGNRAKTQSDKKPSQLHFFLSKGAFTVYIIHTGVLIEISLLMKDVPLPAFVKFVLVGGLAVVSGFLLAWPLRQIPGVKKIL